MEFHLSQTIVCLGSRFALFSDRELTKEELTCIFWSLDARKNLIETGVAHLSAQDVARMGPGNPNDIFDHRNHYKIKALTDEQKRLTLLISSLMEQIGKYL